MTSKTPKVLSSTEDKLQGKYYSMLKLGMKGSFAKWEGHGRIEMEILGVLQFHQYDEGHYYWEEWFLVGDDGYYWIEYDKNTRVYTFYQQLKLTGEIPTTKARPGQKVKVGKDEEFRIGETGSATLTNIEGEIPWKAKVGEKVHFYDGSGNGFKYSVEWTAEEVELYRGKVIDEIELLRDIFKDKERAALAEELRAKRRRQNMYVTILVLLIICTMCCFLMFMPSIGAFEGGSNIRSSGGSFIGGGGSFGK